MLKIIEVNAYRPTRNVVNNNTGRQNKTDIRFQKPDYTFTKVFDALNPNLNAKWLYHLRISRYPNLNMQKRPFSPIFEVMYAKQVNFAQKSTNRALKC